MKNIDFVPLNPNVFPPQIDLGGSATMLYFDISPIRPWMNVYSSKKSLCFPKISEMTQAERNDHSLDRKRFVSGLGGATPGNLDSIDVLRSVSLKGFKTQEMKIFS